MLSALFKKKKQGNPESDITIITPFSAQRALYLEVIRDLTSVTKLPLEKLPRVETFDTMHGHESDVVIIDWVICYHDELGILSDGRLVNVALTRCRASLITVFHDGVVDVGPGRVEHTKTPQLRAHWDHLKSSGLVIDVKEG